MSTELLPCPFCGWPAESNAGGLDIYCSNQYGCDAFDCSMSVKDWNRRFVCLDKNGDPVYAGNKVRLGCGCCEYVIELRNGFAVPVDDGQSQVHGKDINVWECEIELIKEDKHER